MDRAGVARQVPGKWWVGSCGLSYGGRVRCAALCCSLRYVLSRAYALVQLRALRPLALRTVRLCNVCNLLEHRCGLASIVASTEVRTIDTFTSALHCVFSTIVRVYPAFAIVRVTCNGVYIAHFKLCRAVSSNAAELDKAHFVYPVVWLMCVVSTRPIMLSRHFVLLIARRTRAQFA